MKSRTVGSLMALGFVLLAAGNGTASDQLLEKLKGEIAAGTIAYRLSEEPEIVAVLGKPLSSSEQFDGGMELRRLKYPEFEIYLAKRKESEEPFALAAIAQGDKMLDFGRDRILVLRTEADLKKIDPFSGLANVSLAKLDLRPKMELINGWNFDTDTVWPTAEKLPEGFDPARILKSAMTPGLGLRRLHEKGLDGRGVGVAVIDQPLLLGHEDYSGRVLRYDASGLDGFSPAMHGSAVVDILVGRNCGVAPASSLTYFAVPMWENDNLPYVRSLNRILELNAVLPPAERIRVVSISDGAFAGQGHAEEWRAALKRTEDAGILVVTCDRTAFNYGTLACLPGRDPDEVASYVPGRYAGPDDRIRVPADNRTLAGERGPSVYVFYREGGMSWGAPYIAGLAALAFQADPSLKPDEIRRALIATARPSPAGPMVDPAAFLNSFDKK